jgi:glutathione-specific gamma-glutamylcyclotransferase
MPPLWVFAYGSLIWDTCFPVAAQHLGRVAGWQRTFCMWSVRYRGTDAAPGLVLALDRAPGAFCDGVAFRVTQGAEDAALAELRKRELISSAYLETTLPVRLDTGDTVQAVAFVIDPAHAQYAGRLSADDQARIIARATGLRGPNRDYLFATAAHLASLGLRDAEMEALCARVRDLPL